MFQMIEVVGTSGRSYSEAARSAVEKLTAQGEEVHFFEITEQRGSVRSGKIEFQIKLKAAVEQDIHRKRKNG
jgi:flavin-binding protein dodecin